MKINVIIPVYNEEKIISDTIDKIESFIKDNDNYYFTFVNDGSSDSSREIIEKRINEIREKYPKAVIILATTILAHDKSWDDAIEEVYQELDDARIRHFLYTRNGVGTSGHIRTTEAEEMSDELAEFIENLDIPVWEEYEK